MIEVHKCFSLASRSMEFGSYGGCQRISLDSVIMRTLSQSLIAFVSSILPQTGIRLYVNDLGASVIRGANAIIPYVGDIRLRIELLTAR